MKAIGIGCLIAVVLVAIGYYEVSIWQECLAHNSWFYCSRVLSH